MAVLTEALKTLLENDATLAALLTGGVFDAADLPQDGGGSASAPRAADGISIAPYAVIRWRASSMYGPETVQAERETCEIYLYQDIGYSTINQAVSRIKVLLNRQFITASDRSLAHLEYTYTSGEVPAMEIGGAACKFSRYSIIHIRN